MNWQPIESAPKDQGILAWTEDGLAILFHSNGYWCDSESRAPYVTHWIHLPAPPSHDGSE